MIVTAPYVMVWLLTVLNLYGDIFSVVYM